MVIFSIFLSKVIPESWTGKLFSTYKTYKNSIDVQTISFRLIPKHLGTCHDFVEIMKKIREQLFCKKFICVSFSIYFRAHLPFFVRNMGAFILNFRNQIACQPWMYWYQSKGNRLNFLFYTFCTWKIIFQSRIQGYFG